MDKISGIIPQTPRTASKRFTDSTPVRPGAPQFGRPEGSSEIKDRVSITNVQSTDLKPYRNPREAANVKIVDSLSRKFFLTPESETSSVDTSSEESNLSFSESEPKFTSESVNADYNTRE
jgi:hypothetical protein